MSLLNKNRNVLLILRRKRSFERHFSSKTAQNNNSRATSILILVTSRKTPTRLFLNLKNFNSTSTGSGAAGSRSSSYLKTSLKYLISIGLGTSVGLVTGYYLMLDQFRFVDDQNQAIRSFLNHGFEPTKFIEHKDSPYREFPLTIHVYQYESCPYCSQIRAYLDYFGFSYKLTEVDSYSKEELTSFTKARLLPIVVLEDKINKKRWHLTNATSILSAFESLRNEQQINYADVLNQYLPILKANTLHYTINPYKYHVSNSDLNSIEWRKWINNQAIPAFRLNSISNLKDLFETFDFYSDRSNWKLRYNSLKYVYVYYSNAYNTYKQRSTYLKQLSPDDSQKEPRKILNEIITKWESGLKNSSFIGGSAKPNLADLSMFGAIRAFEGCALFRESIAKHEKFRTWYEQMKSITTKRHKHDFDSNVKSFACRLQSVNEEDFLVVDKRTYSELVSKSSNPTASSSLDANNKTPKISMPEKEVFRVLSINYLVHVFVFTYAAWMSR